MPSAPSLESRGRRQSARKIFFLVTVGRPSDWGRLGDKVPPGAAASLEPSLNAPWTSGTERRQRGLLRTALSSLQGHTSPTHQQALTTEITAKSRRGFSSLSISFVEAVRIPRALISLILFFGRSPSCAAPPVLRRPWKLKIRFPAGAELLSTNVICDRIF